MYKRNNLANGLRVVTKNIPGVNSLSLGIWLNIGGRYENASNKGISHFLEHLLFKGTRKYSCRKIKESIEGTGGALNGFTSEEFTCYLVKIPYRYWSASLDILSDMVLNPSLKVKDIEKERSVILEELKMYKDLPQSYVYELLDELLWPNQPLGAPIIGTVDSLRNIGRPELAAFQNAHYTPENIVISAVGRLNERLLNKKIKSIFAHRASSGANIFLKTVENTQAKNQLKIVDKDTEQTHMAMGFCSLKREHHLKHAQTLLHIILGANMSSRLFNEVREKRALAYEIATAVKRFSDTGAFLVHAGIDNRKVNDCLGLIFKELSKVKKNGVLKDEFRRAKEFYLGQLLLSLEDTMEHMLMLGESLASMNKIHTLQEMIKEVNRVSLNDLKQVAQLVFQDGKINLALIGPLKNKEKVIFSRLFIR
jgi:predicted Zn-dependent peptidase